MLQESGWWHGKSRALVNSERSSSYLLIWLSFLKGRQLHQLTSVACSMSTLLPVSCTWQYCISQQVNLEKLTAQLILDQHHHTSGCHPPASPEIQTSNKLCKRRRSDHCISQAQEAHKYYCPLSPQETPHESCCESSISLPGQHGT